MIGMPEALSIMSLCGVVIAAIVTRRPRETKPVQQDHLVVQSSCVSCKAELMRRIDERSEETGSIFRELKEQGKQLARIEAALSLGIKAQAPQKES